MSVFISLLQVTTCDLGIWPILRLRCAEVEENRVFGFSKGLIRRGQRHACGVFLGIAERATGFAGIILFVEPYLN